MTPMRVVADDEWSDRMAECLTHFGVVPRPSGQPVAPDLNTSTLPREVVHQTCRLRYPKQSDLRFVLGPFEQRRLWSCYYVFELQPCLRGAGVPVTRSPSFGEYLAARRAGDAWHPYRTFAENATARDVQHYDDLCPRFPEWLRGRSAAERPASG